MAAEAAEEAPPGAGAEPEGAGLEGLALTPRDVALLGPDGTVEHEYEVGYLDVEGHIAPLISISVVSGKVLVAVPGTVWHRRPQRRVWPALVLQKPQAVEVVCRAEDDPAEAATGERMKVWLGYLAANFNDSMPEPNVPQAFLVQGCTPQ